MENSKEQGKKKISNENLSNIVGGMSNDEFLYLYDRSTGNFRVHVIAGFYVGKYGTVIGVRVGGRTKSVIAEIEFDDGDSDFLTPSDFEKA